MKAIYTAAAMVVATQTAAQTPETSTWLCDNQMGAVITLTAQTTTDTGTITLRGLPTIETRVWQSGLNLIWTWEDDDAWYLQQNNALNHIEPSLNIFALALGSIGLYSGPVSRRGQTLTDILGDVFDQLTDEDFHERMQEAVGEGPYSLIFRCTPE